jgi:hypothetical protein
VAPARIVVVVRALGAALASARGDAQPFVGATPPAALVKELVAARAAGASAADTIAVMRANGREHALAVLTELLVRGCPTAAATRAVTSLAARDRALEELLTHAERMRAREGAVPADAIVTLARDGQGNGAEHANNEVADDDGRGPNRETSGARGPRSGGVAAGHSRP